MFLIFKKVFIKVPDNLYYWRAMSNGMESTWERRNKIYPIQKDQVQQLFYPLILQKKITSITYLSGGLRNTNYKVLVDGYKTPFILRIYTDEDESCEKELAIYKFLKDIIPVPKVYYTSRAKDVIDKQFSILGYLEGITMANMMERGQQPEKKIVREIGTLLGMIHGHQFEKTGFLDKNLNICKELGQTHQWLEEYVLEPASTGKARQKLSHDLVEKLRVFVKKEKPILSEEFALVLTHGDFKPTNILISRNKITGILDWEFAFAAPYYFDLGQILRYDEDLPQHFESQLIAGYRQNIDYTISENWKRMAKLIDLINLIGFLNDSEERPEMQKQVVNLISKTIRTHH